jgi:hypothetical protein
MNTGRLLSTNGEVVLAVERQWGFCKITFDACMVQLFRGRQIWNGKTSYLYIGDGFMCE